MSDILHTEKISLAEMRARYGSRNSKYGNRRCKEDGYTFDSEAERDRYREIRLLLNAHRISEVCVHPRFPLVVNGAKIGAYVADFSYTETVNSYDGPVSTKWVEDVKGAETAVFKLKAKLFRALYPDHELRLIPA